VETLTALALVTGIIAMTPVLIWAMQGLKPKNGGGAMGAAMDGFAAGYEPRQEHLQIAKRHKKQGGSENGDPPSLEG
jgi:hypothetical protein